MQLISAPGLVLEPIVQLNSQSQLDKKPSRFGYKIRTTKSSAYPASLKTWTPHGTECEEHCRSYALFAYSLYFSGTLPVPYRRPHPSSWLPAAVPFLKRSHANCSVP